MRYLAPTITLILATTVAADRNSPEFLAYKERLKERRVYALQLRREINAARPPARGWTAVRVPVNVMSPMGIGIQQGLIQQSPVYSVRGRWDGIYLPLPTGTYRP